MLRWRGAPRPCMAALHMRQRSAPVTGPRCTPTPTRRRVHWSMTTRTQSLWSTMDSPRQRSTLHRLSVVWPMNDTHEGPVPPGMGRECVDSTRYTTCLSMVAPNVRELMRALRGQPNRGVRDTCLCGTRSHAEDRGPARARRHPLMPGPSAPGSPTSAGERGGLPRRRFAGPSRAVCTLETVRDRPDYATQRSCATLIGHHPMIRHDPRVIPLRTGYHNLWGSRVERRHLA